MKMLGVIDIGTNTILCLKASMDKNGVNIIFDKRFHYRAGKRLDEKGNISSEYKTSLKKTLLSALKALGNCSKIRIVATEVLRKPEDGSVFARELSNQIGHHIEIIDPQREAELSFLGATYGIGFGGEYISVLDVGGGSSELAVGRDDKLIDWSSVKLGAVVACETSGYEKRFNEYMDIAIKAFQSSDFSRLLALPIQQKLVVGGSAVAIAAMLSGQKEYDPQKLQGYVIRRDTLVPLLDKLGRMTIDERKKAMVFDAERVDIIVGGGAIILAFMEYADIPALFVSTRGLRYGLLKELGK